MVVKQQQKQNETATGLPTLLHFLLFSKQNSLKNGCRVFVTFPVSTLFWNVPDGKEFSFCVNQAWGKWETDFSSCQTWEKKYLIYFPLLASIKHECFHSPFKTQWLLYIPPDLILKSFRFFHAVCLRVPHDWPNIYRKLFHTAGTGLSLHQKHCTYSEGGSFKYYSHILKKSELLRAPFAPPFENSIVVTNVLLNHCILFLTKKKQRAC